MLIKLFFVNNSPFQRFFPCRESGLFQTCFFGTFVSRKMPFEHIRPTVVFCFSKICRSLKSAAYKGKHGNKPIPNR